MSAENPCFTLKSGNDKMQVTLFAQKLGEDISVTITGGTQPHLGAVALAQHHASLSEHSVRSATASLLVIPPHKEGELAQNIARRLAVEYNCNVLVAAGIHIDNATTSQIKQLLENSEDLVQKLLASNFIVRDNK